MSTQAAPGGSVSIDLPPGWTLTAGGGRGAIRATGPNGEIAVMNIPLHMLDPNFGSNRQMIASGYRAPGIVVVPTRVIRSRPSTMRRTRSGAVWARDH